MRKIKNSFFFIFKAELTEGSVIDALPLKHTTVEIIAVNKIQSERETSGLADVKTQYQYDPVSAPAKQK